MLRTEARARVAKKELDKGRRNRWHPLDAVGGLPEKSMLGGYLCNVSNHGDL